jgi:hypothetical protein
MSAPEALSTACKEPRTGTVSIFKIFRQNNICMSAIVGSQYGATTAAAESLIAQLHSQGIAHYAETRKSKNSTRKRNFKSKQNPSFIRCKIFRSIDLYQKHIS